MRRTVSAPKRRSSATRAAGGGRCVRAALAHLPDAREALVVETPGDLDRDQVTEVHAQDGIRPRRGRDDQVARPEAGADLAPAAARQSSSLGAR